jgi:hypothetical protein
VSEVGDKDLGRGAGASPMRWVRQELGRGLELAALAAFAFSRPVLDAFGRSPETFVINRVGSSQIILFGVVVALVPALAALLLTLGAGAVCRWLADHQRPVVHAAMLAVLAGVGANRMGQDQTGWPWTASRLVLLGLATAVLVVFLLWWSRSAEILQTFLRFGSVAVLVFLFQFLAASPTGELALGSGPAVNVEIAEQVTEQLGDEAPPVVLVVFDALPTMMLLDGEGAVDADLYPNFARLADDSTFYRNFTTVSGFTAMAVPTILRGVYPERDTQPADTDENLFTLLGGSYQVQAMEQVTRYCPSDVCARQSSGGVGLVLDEAVSWWIEGALTDAEEQDLNLLADHGSRYEDASEWIDGLEFGITAHPDLVFLHTILPHNPWTYTDRAVSYEAQEPVTGMVGVSWSEAGWLVAQQRQVLQAQASDRLLGRLLDRLEDAGIYDDALVIVTADHGASFRPLAPHRAITPENAAEIAWVPLLVKVPDQDEGVVDDGNVESVDVLPTITDALGVEPFWAVDGMPAPEAATTRGPIKNYVTHQFDGWSEDEDEVEITFEARDYLDEVLAARPPVGTGADGGWRLTEHGDLVGSPLDELAVGDPADGELRVDWSEDFDDVDVDRPLALEVVTGTGLPDGDVVAFALNGSVAGLGVVQEWGMADDNLLNAILLPDLFEQGNNELEAYLVEGAAGEESLHPLDVRF